MRHVEFTSGVQVLECDVVLATLRFSTHEFQGHEKELQVFQDILVTDIVKLNK